MLHTLIPSPSPATSVAPIHIPVNTKEVSGRAELQRELMSTSPASRMSAFISRSSRRLQELDVVWITADAVCWFMGSMLLHSTGFDLNAGTVGTPCGLVRASREKATA